uniref:Uncharacterized protein n=1 Tax=Cacopsylla melanoneura TaxID=428564 RepID=A0A8D8SPV1_9HEMI
MKSSAYQLLSNDIPDCGMKLIDPANLKCENSVVSNHIVASKKPGHYTSLCFKKATISFMLDFCHLLCSESSLIACFPLVYLFVSAIPPMIHKHILFRFILHIFLLFFYT